MLLYSKILICIQLFMSVAAIGNYIGKDDNSGALVNLIQFALFVPVLYFLFTL